MDIIHGDEYTVTYHGQSLYQDLLVAADFRYQRSANWASAVPSLEVFEGDPDHEILYSSRNYDGQEVVLKALGTGEWVAVATLNGGQIGLRVAASGAGIAEAAFVHLSKLAPRFEAEDDHRVPVTFWSLSPHGPQARTRLIDVPDWESIDVNYAADARDGLDALMAAEFAPGVGGQLILWHGEPGTGKTYALRALAWQWREWCDLHYIADPEVFFGDQASYMLEVLLHDAGSPEPAGGAVPERWRLLVLEDTGELLTADAKERTGQALSRLLNAADGLIGQGLRVLVLVTTNEEVKALHPAVARAGRCAARVEFPKLSGLEVEDWVERQGLAAMTHVDVGGVQTVADLYAQIAGHRTHPRQPVGFTA